MRISVRALIVLSAAAIVGACGGEQLSPTAVQPIATDAAATAPWPTCDGGGFSISYPPGWFVHPAKEAAGAADCTLFAKDLFAAELEPDGGWTGAQVVVRTATGCQGSFEVVLSEEELDIEGYPAWARQMAVGEGTDAGQPSAYEYTVNLAPEERCENGRWFFGRTEVDAPGDHVENSATLDRMMESVRFVDS